MKQNEVREVITFLFPNGTRGSAGDIAAPPLWPVDLFAVSAYLALMTDCYTELLDLSSPTSVGAVIHDCHADLVLAGADLGSVVELDACLDSTFDLIHETWDEILSGTNGAAGASPNSWKAALLKQLILADTACEGMGFFDPNQEVESDPVNRKITGWIPQVYAWMSNPGLHKEIVSLLRSGDTAWYWDIKPLVLASDIDQQATGFEKRSSPSACLLIDPKRFCVLPKVLTPRVGCTIRSLAKNLSVHPGIGQVESKWFNHRFDSRFRDDELTILIVPYPFTISSADFKGSPTHIPRVNTFEVKQNWLTGQPYIVGLVKGLLEEASTEGRNVDVVILPELALDNSTYMRIAEKMAEHSSSFMMLIAGVSAQEGGHHINASYTAYIEDRKVRGVNIQKKHHRWRLDDEQIKTYNLSGQLHAPTEVDWWENTSVTNRTVDYHVFQNGACFASLICEDLGRQDPCKPSIQSVGPNLIFALLMDAPQLKNRWPGRYTTGLIEDPGSSLLTVTSLGLVTRSNWLHNGTRQTVALWGDQNGIREIDLPAGHHGVVLVLAKKVKDLYTLDNRKGEGQFWEYETMFPLKGQNS